MTYQRLVLSYSRQTHVIQIKKKRSWKTKAFLNDLDIPETSDLRKKDIEEEVVLEL